MKGRPIALAGLALVALLAACSAPPEAFPGASSGRGGVVATSHPEATEVGVQVLRAGGNAVDAAVAVSFALGIAEPWNSGIGGGSLILVRMRDGRTAAIDGRETAPKAATRDMYLDRAGKPTNDSRTGPRAIAVPGTVAALALARQRFGTRPWRELIAPSIDLAKRGPVVTPRMAKITAASMPRLHRFARWRKTFLPGGIPPLPGRRLPRPDLARSYERIAREGPGALHGGALGREVAGAVRAEGGLLTLEDLRSYRALEREPLRGSYRGYEVLGFPPPGGGAVVIETLNLLEPFPLAREKPGSANAIHLGAEALKLAFADRALYLGDPSFVKVPTAGLISKAYAKRRGRDIRADRAARVAGGGDPPEVPRGARADQPLWEEGRQTTHFSIVDRAGNAVAVTQTINLPYGSGVIAGDTGILMNDEMDDFSVKPGAPNAFGLVGAEANAIAPGKRPLSSQAPTILVRGGSAALVLGSPGGPRIISAVVETIVNVVDFRMAIQRAVDARRYHHQWLPDVLDVEEGTPAAIIAELAERGHVVKVKPEWGSVQAVAIDQATAVRNGGSDARSGGKAQAE